MTTKEELIKNELACQVFVMRQEEFLGAARDRLTEAKKELAEYQEPTIPVDTLCEVWSDEARKAVDDLENKYGIEVVSAEHNEKIFSLLEKARKEIKELKEPGLSWKDIDNNVPEAEVYLAKLPDKRFFIMYRVGEIKGQKGQYIILKK